MKNTTKSAYLKQMSAFRVTFKNINEMASVKRGQYLARLLINLIPVLGLHTTSAKVRSIYSFLAKLYQLFRNNGAKGACLTLKVYAVILQQSIGGHVVRDLTGLKFRVSRTRAGLPRIIPRVHREMIRKGDFRMIRFYLTIFNLYRVIDFTGDMRFASLVKTIVAPAVITQGLLSLKGEMLKFVPVFFRRLQPLIGLNAKSLRMELLDSYQTATAFPLLKSSPFTMPLSRFSELSREEAEEAMVTQPVVSSHPLAAHEAANALHNNSDLHDSAHYFLGLLQDHSILRKAWLHATRYPLKPGMGVQSGAGSSQDPILGRLALKEEAAGKVRVFAMVDCWTQWLLKPLHVTIFDHILPGIPQDGTRDQMAPVYSLIRREPTSLFSLDLSAATDRLPIWLQIAVLGGFTGQIFAQSWAEFLVNRDYSLVTMTPKNRVNGKPKPITHRVRYSVGQPMGALSSWAMLALTHHFVVQFAAYRVGHRSWFQDYAVLGDDLVIGNARVANMYLSVMRTLGVGIGLHKSLISASGSALEFAKRTIYLGQDVSPVTLTEFKSAFAGPANAVEFIKKYNLTLAVFVKAAGYGYRVLGTLNKPLGLLNGKIRLIILALNVPLTVEDVEAFFKLGTPKSGRAMFETLAVIDAMVDKEYKLLQRAVNAVRFKLMSLEGAHLHAKDMAIELLPLLSEDIKVSAETQELLDWAKAQLRDRSHLSHWIKGEGFLMSPVAEDALSQTFKAELEFADAHPELVLKGAERLYKAELLKDLIPMIKTLQYMTQGHYKTVASEAAAALKERLTSAMLAKYDMTASELFMELISISQNVALLPLSNLKYARIVEAPRARFTEGTYIRLWKSLSGLAQGAKTKNNKKVVPDAPKEFTGWW